MKKVSISFVVFVVAIFVSGCMGTGNKPISSEKTTGNIQTNKAETRENAKAELISTHWEAYTNSIDTNWAIITGVVENTGDVVVKLDDASGTVYNEEGKAVGNDTEMFSPNIIAPGEKAYVAVQIMDTVDKKEIVDSKLQFSFDETTKKPVSVGAVNDSSRRDDHDYTVTGELENPTDERIQDVRVAGLFYDKEGNLINVERGYPEPDAIPPKGAVSFEISSSHFSDLISDYKLVGFVF